VVLIKSNNLEEVAIFEFDTIRYDPDLYEWKWNSRNNLESYNMITKKHCFTWQPHGSQFTILEDVPTDCLVIHIKKPPQLDKNEVLSSIGFDNSWVTVIRKITKK
jgi:hypothetical protein